MSMGIQKLVLRKNIEEWPLVVEDLWDDLDDGEVAECGCELGMVDGNMCSIPYELYDLPDLRDVLSLDTWNSCLTEEERFNLSAHLPDMDQQTFCSTMKELFDGSDLYFGNPLDMFFQRLKAGYYPPMVTICRESLFFLKRRKFYHSLKRYHDRMVHRFFEMKGMWDEIEVSSGVEERIALWTKRRKLECKNVLDLNRSPREENVPSDEVSLDVKRMKAVAPLRSKSILPSQNTKGAKNVTPSSGAKGVLKRKGSNLLQSHAKKFVAGIKSEQFPSVHKGAQKIAPKLSSVRVEQSEALATVLPVSLLNRNSIALPESSFKLNEPMGLGSCYFGSENLRPNVSGATTNDISLKHSKSHPFSNQLQGGKPQLAITREERASFGPRTQDVVARFTNSGNRFLGTLALSSADRIKVSGEVRSPEAGKLLSESVSDRISHASQLPLTLTYKRRKARAKVNSLDLGRSPSSVGVLQSVTLKEQH